MMWGAFEWLFKVLNKVPNQPQGAVDTEAHDDLDPDDSRGETEREPLPEPESDSLAMAELAAEAPNRSIADSEVDEDFWLACVDLTAKSNVKDKKGRRRRKGMRSVKQLTRIVWHQTAFTWRRYDPKKWSSHHKINAHICIDVDGKVLLLHPLRAYLWTANGFNRSCISIEVMGNFEGVQGTGNWYKPEKFGRGRPNPIQLQRCRQLTRFLVDPRGASLPVSKPMASPLKEWRDAMMVLKRNPLEQVNAHRQSGTKRGRPNRLLDPGSEVWQEVGVWSQREMGLTDGGKGFHLQGAAPIPKTWDPDNGVGD